MRHAEAKLPAFTKGKSQLTAKEVQESRELVVVRIHMERMIGLIKQKYTMELCLLVLYRQMVLKSVL